MSKVLLNRINLIILLISCITAACAQSFFNFGKNNNASATTSMAPSDHFPAPNKVMTPEEFQKTIADAQAAAQKKANQNMQQPNPPAAPVTPPVVEQPRMAPPLQTAPVSSPPTQLTPPPKPVQTQPGIQAPLPATPQQQPAPNLPLNNPQAAPQQQQPQPYTGFGTTPPNTPNNTNNKQSGGWNIKY